MTNLNQFTLENYLNQVRYAAAICNLQGEFILVNQVFEETLGISITKDSEKNLRDFFSEVKVFIEAFEQVLSEEKSVSVRDVILPIHDGSMISLQADFLPVPDTAGKFSGVALCLYFAHNDWLFGEQKKRSVEIERLGLIASGLAHEIKNPLSAIRGAAQFIEKRLPEDSSLIKYSSMIIHESDRVDRLVRELMQLTRPRELNLEAVSLNTSLHDIVQLLLPSAPEQVRIIESYDPSLPSIHADIDALEQIFLNLLKNAIEAVGASGEIHVTSRFVTDMVFRQNEKKRMLVAVTIEDSGPGMDEDVQKKIFTPFFTTKAEGNGLGLFIVNRLVELHQGNLGVRSKSGHGTTIEVMLPV